LFNCRTKAGMMLDSELASIVRDNVGDVDVFSSLHPDFYDNLVKRGFLVDEAEDEFASWYAGVLSDEENPSNFEVIVNPTMDCNLRCWYCYEKHLSGTIMSRRTQEAVCRLMHNELEKESIERLTLSFFGGEPLLGFHKCVKPLVSYLKGELARHEGKSADIGFTTNAVLLTSEVADFFAEVGLPVSCQVPFDGGPIVHDKTKVDASGHGTFDTIVKNVRYALDKGFSFIIRCNYTEDNIGSFSDLADMMAPLAASYPAKLRFSLQQVWQQKDSPELSSAVDALARYISGKGLSSTDGRGAQGGHCYADSANSLVVNYDGNVFKCTARSFSPATREGIITDDGSVEYNERYVRRMESRFSNAACRECRIFPLCEMCTQHRMEKIGVDKCYYSYDETEKEAVVRSSIRTLFGS